MSEAAKSMSQMARAEIIRSAVLEHGKIHGRWEALNEREKDKDIRLWVIDAGLGWSAYVATRFSGLPSGIDVADYDGALLMQIAPLKPRDTLMDVYVDGGPKVMSIETAGEELRLIGMEPGPWEALFGLPHRDWTPAMARRLAKRAA